MALTLLLAAYFAERWRRSAYHEAPARIEQVMRAAPNSNTAPRP